MAEHTSTITASAPLSPKKSVNFNELVMVKEISYLPYICNDMKVLFYNRKEYLAFGRDAKKTVHRMEKSRHDEDSKSTCTRGLECKTARRRIMKAFLMVEAQTAVFLEQHAQVEVGEFDPDMISCLYRDFTREAAKEARKLGETDAKFVRENIANDSKLATSSPWFPTRLHKRQPTLRKVAGAAA
jgi:hypothetical protein